MFNKFKGFNLDAFLDSKLAEDESKKAAQQGSSKPPAKRTPSAIRRGSARAGTPSGRREGSRLRAPDGESPLPIKSPDPEEFVIGDDASDISAISRAPTPAPAKERGEPDESAQPADSPDKQDGVGKGKETATAADEELPLEVRRKLAKLDTLTTKYQDLLKNYRMAHSRVAAIEPFEATLREHTSLTTIAEPSALVEFLEARNLQKDMVMEELKRISGEHNVVVKERDELKVKLGEAEKQAKEAFDEAAGLREETGTKRTAEGEKKAGDAADGGASEALGQADTPRGPPTEDETFFDYDAELPHLQEEMREQKVKIDEQTAYINELNTEIAQTRQSYDAVQLDLNAMYNKVDVKEREMQGLRAQLNEVADAKETTAARRSDATSLADAEKNLAQVQQQLNDYRDRAEKDRKELQARLDASEKKYQLEHDGGQQEKRKQFQEKILNSMREQLKEVQEAKSVAEGKYRDLELEFNRMSSECDNKGEIITNLRGQEDANKSLRDRNAKLEKERDEAFSMMESKKGHESKVASLQSQLKRSEKDKEDAYKIILSCGRCEMPSQNGEASTEGATQISTPATRSRHGSETTQQTEVSTQPTEVSTPPAEADAPANGESKKKGKNKKKKAKAKKDTPEANEAPKSEEVKAAPAKGPAVQSKELANEHLKFVMDKIQADEDENAKLLRHHEGKIEEHEHTIRQHLEIIRSRDEEIVVLNGKLKAEEAEVGKLNGKLKDQEALVEELDGMRDTLADMAKENTDFKHERKTASDGRAALQTELDEAVDEGNRLRKQLKELENDMDKLVQENAKFREESEQQQKLADEGYRADLVSAVKERDDALEGKKQADDARAAYEKQIGELKAQIEANDGNTADLRKQQEAKLSKAELEKSSIEKDLAAANSLAQTRFKDLTDLREHSHKLQAELKKVKEEAGKLRSAKSELEKSNGTLKKLEAKEKDLRSEIAEYKSQITAKDSEIAALKDKVKKGDERSTALEDTYERARKDLENNEKTRDDAIDARDKAQAALKKLESELRSTKTTLDDLQSQVRKFQTESSTLRKDLESKSALLTTSQASATGYQDQQREMAAQVKEHKDRADALEEELQDVHRLLSERGREGETMRRLIEDVKNERDRKVREMQTERDRAVEERDRADDEASSIGRWKAREIAELKAKLADAEALARRAEEARGEVERREREFRRLREELEGRAARAEEDLSQRREAMAQLQRGLDESERQCAGVERERGELLRTLEERQVRLEKVQKASKALAEELAALKAKGRAGRGSSARASVDTSRVPSPTPSARANTPQLQQQQQGLGAEMVNRDVIRQTLLNFMQQKDKRVQMQMVGPGGPLAKMLGFRAGDEVSWMSAVGGGR